jgi:hypothetical protein
MSAQVAPVEGESPPRAAAMAASLLCLVPAIVVAVAPGWVLARI